MHETQQICPYCGIEYKKFKTGETFKSIRDLLWVGDEDSSKWKYKRRHTVLGLWRQIKISMWEEHIKNCVNYSLTQNNHVFERIEY